MARESEIILRYGTRAALNAVAAANGLLKGEPFLIDDEDRGGVALSASTYETFAKQSEAGGGAAPTNIDGGNAASVAASNVDGGSA